MSVIRFIIASGFKDAGIVMRIIYVAIMIVPPALVAIENSLGLGWGVGPWWLWLILGIVGGLLFLLYSISKKAISLQKSELMSWFELEARFKELEVQMWGARIDSQTGSHGQHWHIAGNQDEDISRRFNALAAIAGTRLIRDFPSEIEKNKGFDSESDPAIRWFKALVLIGERYEQGPTFEEIDDDGTSTGHIFTGSIQKPAMASATLCLELASRGAEDVTR